MAALVLVAPIHVHRGAAADHPECPSCQFAKVAGVTPGASPQPALGRLCLGTAPGRALQAPAEVASAAISPRGPPAS